MKSLRSDLLNPLFDMAINIQFEIHDSAPLPENIPMGDIISAVTRGIINI